MMPRVSELLIGCRDAGTRLLTAPAMAQMPAALEAGAGPSFGSPRRLLYGAGRPVQRCGLEAFPGSCPSLLIVDGIYASGAVLAPSGPARLGVNLAQQLIAQHCRQERPPHT
jgi:hypothetical protein